MDCRISEVCYVWMVARLQDVAEVSGGLTLEGELICDVLTAGI